MREVPFTNKIGQVLQPGDEVVVVTTVYQRARTTTGQYVGLSPGGSPQAKVATKIWDNGGYRSGPGRIMTLQNNNIFKVV